MKFSPQIENLIANLRGVPESKTGHPTKQALPIDSIVEVILERYKIGKPSPEETLMLNWKKILGPTNAIRCMPQKLDDSGVLVVSVSSSVLKRELLFKKDVILTEIQKLAGCDFIREILFRAG